MNRPRSKLGVTLLQAGAWHGEKSRKKWLDPDPYLRTSLCQELDFVTVEIP